MHPQEKLPNFIHAKLERLATVQGKDGEDLRQEFSSYRCECCNGLAGERYTVKAHYWNKRARNGSSAMRGTFEVCPDCIYIWQ
jgi:hypothetical protein